MKELNQGKMIKITYGIEKVEMYKYEIKVNSLIISTKTMSMKLDFLVGQAS